MDTNCLLVSVSSSIWFNGNNHQRCYRQVVVPANALDGEPLGPQAKADEEERSQHEAYGKAYHHALGVIVLHLDCGWA